MQKFSDQSTATAGSDPSSHRGLESPSLFGSGAGATGGAVAYELKFLLSEELARAAAEMVAPRLAPDPHGDPALDGAYRTTSIYTDTPHFDVFRRSGEYANSKFRVRRYGAGGPVFLERKDKDGQRVRKCRATVPPEDLAHLNGKPRADWVAEWFRSEVAGRRLAPVCRITYERVAFMGSTDAGAVRVTFDRNIRGELATGWHPTPVGAVPDLLPGFVVCEFKFRVSLPALLKDVVESLGLAPTTVSKYRRFVRAVGLAGADAGEGTVDAE